ncbi:MAG TPA: carboxypeptidase-like regulatory domain-containing protein [Pyrinomonadaceae bacterium]|nr:carboxypeptidase-like regulatory domain-containing protein [Pyrinomonadaceae bacterium]
MSAVELQTPILEGGIRSVNFFNGRLLTANDLSREQEATRSSTTRLGQAIGEGIAFGLEVSQSKESKSGAPILSIEAGLAINRQGQTLRLSDKTDISLVRPASGGVAVSNPFSDCAPLQFGASLTGDGLFLLTVAPAAKNEGRAVVNGLSTSSAPCNTDSVVSAVQFRLVQLPGAIINEATTQARLRNHLAYRCFGVNRTSAFAEAPFATAPESYGLLDSLRTNPLTDCDVPLAILYWTVSAGIKFIDLWSVRRRLTNANLHGSWAPAMSDRRVSEAEASFLQFQEHLDSITRDEGAVNNLEADQRFEFLPAAGFLPASVIDWPTFLGPLAPPRSTSVVEEVMREILHRSFFMEPIKVGKFVDARKAGVSPPVPVEVFVAPGQPDFVLFSRSVKSRVRVFLKPEPPDTGELTIDAAASWTSEIRNAEESGDGNWYEINVSEAGDYSVDVTLPGYVKPSPAMVDAVAGLTTDLEVALAPLPRGSISVTVKDDKTQAVVNDKVLAISATDSDGIVSSAKRAPGGDWQIPELLPDKYFMSVIATGFGAKTIADITVTPNQVTPVTVTLTANAPAKEQPEACVITIATVGKKPFRVKLCMKIKNISFRGSQLEGLVLTSLDKAGMKWAAEWQDWLMDEYKDSDIDLAKPKIYVNPTALLGGGGGRLTDGFFVKEDNPLHRSGKETGIGTGKGTGTGKDVGKGTGKDIGTKRPTFEGVALFGKVAVPLTVESMDDER